MGYNLNLSSVLARRSQRSLLLLIVLATSLIWLFDYFTGPRLSVAIFYLLPVGLASWYVSRRAGFVVAAICAVAWLFNDLSTNLSGDLSLIPLWNAGVRLAIFLLVAHISAALRRARATGRADHLRRPRPALAPVQRVSLPGNDQGDERASRLR